MLVLLSIVANVMMFKINTPTREDNICQMRRLSSVYRESYGTLTKTRTKRSTAMRRLSGLTHSCGMLFWAFAILVCGLGHSGQTLADTMQV